MEMRDEAFYNALKARDPRFDGVFFVGVTSTGIYCRPICPARTPRQDRCRFFSQAAQAEQQGFRPCLRCRPELAPGLAPVDSVSRTAWAAAARIKSGEPEDGLESLARQLGIGGRQLRRVFKRELGVTPVELAQTSRLLLAKQLLTETALPVTDIAFAAGFASLRRFNALFLERYRLSPSDFRRSVRAPAGAGLTLTMAYRPPLAWPPLLRFLAERAIEGVEVVEGESYARTLQLGERRGWLRARPAGEGRLLLEVSLELLPVLPQVLARVRSLLDLDASPATIDGQLSRDFLLAPLVERWPGRRVPGCVDGFEVAWRAVLGQQVTVEGARRLAGRLVAAVGESIETPLPGLHRLTPPACRFLQMSQQSLGELGWLRQRSGAVLALARAIEAGGLSLKPGEDPETATARLLALPGIGPWTASYIAMRALGWSDAWPHGDVVLRRALGGRTGSDPGWSPWSAYAALHLWTSLANSDDSTKSRKKVKP
jgi:AraC family transcriptional regulator of adaptative response / DNA-3-methyladenine glycosylase II